MSGVQDKASPPAIANSRNSKHEAQPDLWTYHQWSDQDRKDCPVNFEVDDMDEPENESDQINRYSRIG